MRLDRRVSLVLIPSFTLLVLVLATATLISLFTQVKSNALETAHLEWEIAQVDAINTQTGIDLTIARLSEKEQLLKLFTVADPQLSEFVINTAFMDFAYDASKTIPGFQSMLLFDQDLHLLNQVDIGRLRSFSPQDTEIDSKLRTKLVRLHEFMHTEAINQGIIAYEVDGGLEFLVARVFSPFVDAGGKLVWSNQHIVVATRAQPEAINALLKDQGVTLSTTGPIAFDAPITLEKEVKDIETGSGNVMTLETPIYRIEQTIGQSDIFGLMRRISVYVTLSAIFSILLLYLVVNRMLHTHILEPIIRLADQIGRSAADTLITLERRDEKNEIDALNNQYVRLLKRIQTLANTDELTQMPNRTQFIRRVEKRLLTDREGSYAMLYLDLDHFKQINDYYGHDEGDQLLANFSAGLCAVLDEQIGTDVTQRYDVSRLAGDEFAAFIPAQRAAQSAEKLAATMLDKLEEGQRTELGVHHMGASIGIAYFPEDAGNATDLLARADEAMFEAKNRGRNRYEVFTRAVLEANRLKRIMLESLEDSIKNGDFYFVFQPIFCSRTMKPVGAEVLLRSRNRHLAEVGTQAFISMAEANGSIGRIDRLVVVQAFAQLARVQKVWPGFYFAINFSAAELVSRGFVELVSSELNSAGLHPELVEMEVTETRLAEFGTQASQTVQSLRDLGVRVSLDDFGTGYNSFTQLNGGAINKLKIDRLFVEAINTSTQNAKMVDIVIGIARLYDLEMVAEGIETQEQLDYLQRMGCHQLQGFLLGKPMEWDKFVGYLKIHAPACDADAHTGVDSLPA